MMKSIWDLLGKGQRAYEISGNNRMLRAQWGSGGCLNGGE